MPAGPEPSSPLRAWLDRMPEGLRSPPVAVGAAVVVVGLVVAGVVLLRPPPGPAPQLRLPQAGAAADAPAAPTGGPSGMATVHAAGAVANPGMYSVPAGGRVADVLTAAGGPLPEAELDRLNLAARVSDGDRVYVPRKGEQPPAGTADTGSAAGSGPASTAAAGPIDLNAATAEQLDTLPGVGPATAQAIITYRTRHGRFRSVTELLEVPGIGPAKLEAVRPLVKV